MTNAEAKDIVDVLLAAYPSQVSRLSTDALVNMARIYKAGLDDVGVNDAKRAVTKLVKTSRFIPTIAEIREAVAGMGTGELKPGGVAWGEVLALVGRYGMHRTPGVDFVIEDQLLAMTVKSFTWRALCLSENQTADRARFIELYDHLAGSLRKHAALAPGASPRRDELADGETRPVGSLLSLVMGGGS